MKGASPMIDTAISLIPTYTVISRHSATCPHKDKGREYVQCGCRKHIAVYDPRVKDPKKRQDLIPAKTRSWTDAESIAQAHRDTHNPDKRARAEAEAKLKAKLSEEESMTVTIEQAVARFLASKKAERVSGKRIKRYLPLLGDVDPQTLKFRSNRRGNQGRLAEWLKTLHPRPIHISDLTPDLVEAFRNSWDFNSDLTDLGSFGDLKALFTYCVSKRWL